MGGSLSKMPAEAHRAAVCIMISMICASREGVAYPSGNFTKDKTQGITLDAGFLVLDREVYRVSSKVFVHVFPSERERGRECEALKPGDRKIEREESEICQKEGRTLIEKETTVFSKALRCLAERIEP